MNNANLIDINWLSVLVAAIAYFALGALWYSLLFSKKWVAYQNIDRDDPRFKTGVAATMISSFVLMFIATAGLAILIELMGMMNVSAGFKLGLLTGICFSATAISITYLYTKKPFGLHLIDNSYHILAHAIAGAIIVLWR
jgi:fatty acid desaturase